ncbi:11195_t:CDS:2 [Ambispora gerdemannii]|uniref:11195_t:CDS:1 n=1 Tax=Ambispora gerdemannii TaxID=144530 RepID=A0A9N8W2Z3_9GLOM|nr:11195_t:CDS:2 [Ambispora gerdemannii]
MNQELKTKIKEFTKKYFVYHQNDKRIPDKVKQELEKLGATKPFYAENEAERSIKFSKMLNSEEVLYQTNLETAMRKRKEAMEKKNSQKEQVGGNTEGFVCKLCYKLYDENEGRMGKIGMICDICEEEPDFENDNNQVKQNISNYQPSNAFISENKKDKQKSIQITNIEELNSKIVIPPELNVIDCPDDVNPNPN